ncbi:MAG: UTP--glucose-1-phosphate uridylyltransferase [Armatimonadota bacterium]
MRITKAVIPAGGRGTRLYPVTKSQPKEMLPLGTKPTIQGVAEEVVAAGATDVLIVTGEAKRAVEDHFDPADGEAPRDYAKGNRRPLFDFSRVKFYYTRQGSPRGLGDAIRYGERFVEDDHFIVALGDCIITSPEPAGPLCRMVRAHSEFAAAGTVLVQVVSLEATARYGIIDPGDALDATAFEVLGIVEKPGPQAAPSRYAVCARYVFSPAIFGYLRDLEPGHGAEIQLTDAIQSMIGDGHRVVAVPLQRGEVRLDVGSFESYSRAFFRTMLTDPNLGEGLSGYVANLLAHLADPSCPDPDAPI